jgi:hypothetical protein
MSLAILAVGLQADVATGEDTPLSAFEVAKSKEGCASIPYEEIQRECRELRDQQSQACDRSTQSCKSEPSLNPKNYLDQIERKSDEYSKLKDALSRDENKDKQGEIRGSMEQSEREISQLRSQLDSVRAQIEVRKGFAEKCVQAQKAVIGRFEYARSRATNEADALKRKIVQDDLLPKWNKSIDIHEQIVEVRNRNIEDCKEWQNLR